MDIQKRSIRFLFFLSLFLVGESFDIPTRPQTTLAQDEATATPDAEGVIYSEVRPNDSLWSIAARAGISLEELLALNGLSEDDIIQPGQLLITGVGTPPPTATTVAPTTAPTATLPPPAPTATAVPPPPTAICLRAFEDADRDGVYDPGESLKAAVAFTIFNKETVVGNYVTDGVSEPYCLEGLTAGNYQVTRSIARGETLTTNGDWAITLTSGNVVNLDFGSFTGSEAVAGEATVEQESGVTPIGATAVTPATPEPENVETGNGRPPPNGVTTGAVVIIVLLLVGVIFFVIRTRQG